MTRFQREVSGELGAYWQRHAIEESENAVVKAKADAVVEEDGAIRWISNGKYIPDDFCEKLEYQGFDFSREATRIAREKQTDKFLEEYRTHCKTAAESEELVNEMRAAFGAGTTVINVITGKRVTL